MNNRLSEKAERDMETLFQCQKRGLELLGLIVAEWKTDPVSVQCFDLRIVQEAKELMEKYERVKPEWYF